jgi:hypothetical protein
VTTREEKKSFHFRIGSIHQGTSAKAARHSLPGTTAMYHCYSLLLALILFGHNPTMGQWVESQAEKEARPVSTKFSLLTCRACTMVPGMRYCIDGTTGLAGCGYGGDCPIKACNAVTGTCQTSNPYTVLQMRNGADCVFRSNHGEVVVAALVLVAVLVVLGMYRPRLSQFLSRHKKDIGNGTTNDAAATTAITSEQARATGDSLEGDGNA